MLQRNTSGSPLDVPAAAVTVQPDGILDWPVPVVGFEPVEEPAAQDPEPSPAPSPPKTRQRAAKSAGEETAR